MTVKRRVSAGHRVLCCILGSAQDGPRSTCDASEGLTDNRPIGVFPADYVILGNRREQVRMAGNAVTPPAARDLMYAVADSLGVTA